MIFLQKKSQKSAEVNIQICLSPKSGEVDRHFCPSYIGNFPVLLNFEIELHEFLFFMGSQQLHEQAGCIVTISVG